MAGFPKLPEIKPPDLTDARFVLPLLAAAALAFYLLGNGALALASLAALALFALILGFYPATLDQAIAARLAPLKKHFPIKEDWLYSSLVVSVILYFAGIPFFVILAVLALMANEIISSVLASGLRSEAMALVLTVGYVLVFWALLSTALGTRAPVNAIISCSMLPNMQRGDLILLSAPNEINAPAVTLTARQFSAIDQNNTLLSFAGSGPTPVNVGRNTYFSYCSSPAGQANPNGLCTVQALNSGIVESYGPLALTIGKCTRVKTDASTYLSPCVTSLQVASSGQTQTFYPNYSDDVVVYDPLASDAFTGGDVIHRVFLKISVPGKNATYYLVKGDNNPVFDFQFYDQASGRRNSIISENQLVGKVVLRVPYLGYLRLLLTPAQYDSGCDSHYLN